MRIYPISHARKSLTAAALPYNISNKFICPALFGSFEVLARQPRRGGLGALLLCEDAGRRPTQPEGIARTRALLRPPSIGTGALAKRPPASKAMAGRSTIYFSNHPELKRGGKLFARNAWTSIVAFCIDLVVLWALVHFAGFPRIVAATIGFLIGISSHYLLSRKFVFPDTDRGLGKGYFYFMLNAGVGLVVTIGLFWGLMEAFPQIHYLILRGFSSLAAGILVFFLNAIFNFRELGSQR